MPTSRSHGGAELQKAPLNLPGGFRGLNTQQTGAILGFEWATQLVNTVLDKGQRITARKGWLRRSGTGGSDGPGLAMMCRVWEYATHDKTATPEYLATDVDGVIWSSKDAGITWSSIGSIDDPYAEMINFRDGTDDKMYIFQDGGEPYVYDGTTLAIHTPAASPNVTGYDGIALSAFGRIWTVTDGTFILYSALQDPNDFDFANPESSSGGFDLRNVWEGTDTVTALVEHNGSLVVFGLNNVVVWSDGQGSDVGMNPQSMYVVDIVHGVGCRARDSVVEVDGDLWWLSDSGIQNLTRTIEQRSNPMQNVSYYVHDDILSVAANTDSRQIQAVYSPEERFVLFSFPDNTQGNEGGLAFCFDSRGFMEDGAARCIGIWNILVPKTFLRMQEKNILMFCGEAGPENVVQVRQFTENAVGIYGGWEDPKNAPSDDPEPYSMVYESAWNNFDTPFIKIPKKMRAILYALGRSDVTLSIWYDFDEFRFDVYNDPIETDVFPDYYTSPLDGSGNFAGVSTEGIEWNDNPTIADKGTVHDQVDGVGTPVQAGEWSGSYKPIIVNVPSVRGTGEYIRIGFQARIEGFPLSLQEMSLYLKQGRLI